MKAFLSGKKITIPGAFPQFNSFSEQLQKVLSSYTALSGGEKIR